MGVPFQTHPADIDERPIKGERPTDYVTRVAREKAEKVSQFHPLSPILAGDTIVSVGTRILRKAKNEQEVYAQLELISGRRHRVHTALALRMPSGAYYTRLSTCHVAVQILETHEKERFVASQEWRNVAVYRIEGLMGMYIRMIRGLHSTVQGLPMRDAYTLLKGHGLLHDKVVVSADDSCGSRGVA
jgi:septum formation protein